MVLKASKIKLILTISLLVMGALSCQRKNFDPAKVNEKERHAKLIGADQTPQAESVNKKLTASASEIGQKDLVEFAFQGCDDELRSCKNVVALKENPKASYELALAATKESSAKTVDRYIRLALEVKTNSSDARVDQLIFSKIIELYPELSKISQERYDKLTQIFLKNDGLLQDEGIKAKIIALSPIGADQKSFSKSVKILFLKAYLKMIDDQSQVQPELQKFFDKNDLAVFVDKIISGNPALLTLVRAKPMAKNLGEYLVINYLNGNYNSQELMDLIIICKEKKIESAATLDLQIANLFKLQTLFISEMANKNFAAYSNVLKKTTDIYDFLEIMTSISSKNRALWAGYLNSLDVGLSLSKLLVDESSQSEMKDLVSNGKRTIQFISSWPHLAAVVYFISKNRLDLEWVTPWGTQKISHKRVIGEFVSGQLKDLLNYLNQDGTLSTEDVVSSLYYAFSTNFFDDINVDAFEFLNETLLRLLSDDILRFTYEKAQLDQAMNKSGYFQSILDRTSVVEKKSGVGYQLDFQEFQNDPVFGNALDKFALVFVSCSDSPKCKMNNSFLGFNLLVKKSEDLVESIKNYLSERIRIIRSIKIALEQSQIQKGKSAAETAEKFKTATPLLDQFDNSLKGYITIMHDYQNLYFNTALKIYDLSREVKVKIFMKEIEHLKNVHALMTKARAGQANEAQMNAYLRSVNFNVNLKQYSTYEKLTAATYTTHVMDHILRMINQTTEYIGGDSSKQSVAILDDTYLKKLQVGLSGDGNARHIFFEIPYNPDLETFLRDGMAKFHKYQNYSGNANATSNDPLKVRSAYASAWFDEKPNLGRIITNFSGMSSHFFNSIGNLYLLFRLFDVNEKSDDVVEMAIKSYHFLNVRPEEADFYKYTGRKGFYEVDLKNGAEEPTVSATFDMRIDQPRGVLEAIYLSVAQPSGTMSRSTEDGKASMEVAFDWGISDYKTNIKRFYLNRKRRGKLFFEVNPQMDALLEKTGLQVLERNYKAVRDLEGSIAKYSKNHYFYHVEMNKRYEVPMLDKRFMETYQTHIDDFNNQTDGKYKAYIP